MQEELKTFLEKYGQRIEEKIERPLHMRVGTYRGEYHQGNGDFTEIQGGIFITTHQGNLFKVYDHEKQIEDTFDVFGSESTITIEEEWFPYICGNNIVSIKQLKLDIKMLNIKFTAYGGAWENEDGDVYGCTPIALKELELVKGISSRYPFEYEYKPSDFDENSKYYSDEWYAEDIFTVDDFENNNVTVDNYGKADAVAFCFKSELVEMLKQLKTELEWLPPRFRQEFIEEVIASCNQDTHSVRKNCEFFSDEIMDELTEKERNRMFITVGE